MPALKLGQITLTPGDHKLDGEQWELWTHVLKEAASKARAAGQPVRGTVKIAATVCQLNPYTPTGTFLDRNETRHLLAAASSCEPYMEPGWEDFTRTIRRACQESLRGRGVLCFSGLDAVAIAAARKFKPGDRVKVTRVRSEWSAVDGRTGTVEHVGDGLIAVSGIDSAVTEKIRGRRGFAASELELL
jgi:hypothetical protein